MATINSSCAFPNITNQTTCFSGLPFSQIGYIFFGIVFASIALAALVGNIIVIVVMLWGEESSKTRNIRVYLLNLAICDIILTLFIPFNYSSEVLTYWILPTWTCGVVHYAQIYIMFNISATLTIIGFERFIVTVYPFSTLCSWLKSHSLILIGSAWITGIIYGCAVFEGRKIYQFQHNDNHTYISCIPKHDSARHYYIELNFVVSFFIPMVMLIVSYGSIMRKLKKRDTICEYPVSYPVASNSVSLNTEGNYRDQNEVKCKLRRTTFSSNTNTQRILFLVVLLYCICWGPKKLVQLLLHYKILPDCSKEDYLGAVYISIGTYLLAMTNCFVNPILYSFMCKKFWKDLNKIKDSVCRRIGLGRDETGPVELTQTFELKYQRNTKLVHTDKARTFTVDL